MKMTVIITGEYAGIKSMWPQQQQHYHHDHHSRTGKNGIHQSALSGWLINMPSGRGGSSTDIGTCRSL
jgi:hypothetical protein